MMTTATMILPAPVLGAVSASPVPPVTLATLDLSGMLVVAAAVVAALVGLVAVRMAMSGRRASEISVTETDRATSLPLAA